MKCANRELMSAEGWQWRERETDKDELATYVLYHGPAPYTN